jgi:putative ATP-dependent endonuclease of OLD family
MGLPMLIKRARIQNFRCLEDVEIAFDCVTTFIGPNGVGKSSVLRALDWFFNGGALTDDDVLFGTARRWIRVEVEFNNLTAEDREALGKYAAASRDTVTVWRTWDGGEEKITGKALAFRLFEEIRSSTEGAVAKRGQYSELRNSRPDLALLPLAASNWAAVEAAMSEWEQAHPERLEEAEVSDTHFFGFAGQGKMSGLFDYVLVTADLRASEEAQDAKAAVFGKILERTIDRTIALEKLNDASSRFRQEQSEIHAKHFGPQLEDISRALSDGVAAFTQGRSVRISPVETDPKPQKVQFAVSILDRMAETTVDRQGHGFQRSLLVAALKLLADQGSANEHQGVICLAIEEPELYQHPVQARAFAAVLRKLAEDSAQRAQITYATHSPFFIEPSHFPQVRRVNRSIRTEDPTPPVGIAHVSLDQVLNQLDGFMKYETVLKRTEALYMDKLPEALFAEAVILVEGSTDQAVIEGFAEREGTLLASDGIVIVEAGGKDGVLLPHAILTLLGIPCYLVFDGDRGCADRMRCNGKTEAQAADEVAKHNRNNRSLLRYFGATEEDWPSTRTYSRYAVFEDCLETELTKEWPAWSERVNELVRSGTGFLEKNRATYRHAAATATGKAPDVFREILAAVRATRIMA